MHAVGLHSALAIRRERRRRAEQQRARERRYSLQSSESGVTSPHCSQGSLERRRARRLPPQDNEVVSSVGMLHLGVVFLVLGLFLVGSGWLPDDVTSWSNVGSASWFNELVCSGLFALAIGVFLIVLHRYLTKSEEDALEEYVQRQLTRSRSGHRLERDAETGGMQTKHARRARATEVGLPPAAPAACAPELYARPAERAHGFLNALALGSADSPLEQIAEEPASLQARVLPPSPSPSPERDTRELLHAARYSQVSRIYAPVVTTTKREPAIQDDRRDASSGGAARAAAEREARRRRRRRRRRAPAQPAAAAARAPDGPRRHALARPASLPERALRLREGGAAARHRGRAAARHRGAGGGAGAAVTGRGGGAAPLLPHGRRRRAHRRRRARGRAQVRLSTLVRSQVRVGCGSGGGGAGAQVGRAQVGRAHARARARREPRRRGAHARPRGAHAGPQRARARAQARQARQARQAQAKAAAERGRARATSSSLDRTPLDLLGSVFVTALRTVYCMCRSRRVTLRKNCIKYLW